MFYLENDNEKTGAYLNSLIKTSRYQNVRQFCIAYLKHVKSDASDQEIQKMQNRFSQIINGKKAIQTYDLPIICELLNVSCEEILSAGKHYEPISGHVTNYEIAFSHDKKVWDAYIQREDQIILNLDEYGKSIIDYALEFRNYKFLKYLMDNKYIWFVDDSKDDSSGCLLGFGAGTSIPRHSFRRTLEDELGNCEKRGLRQKMILLALENKDFDTLTALRAREIPPLYRLCVNIICPGVGCKEYCDEDILSEIEKSGDDVLAYFSEEFEIPTSDGTRQTLIYPFLSMLLDDMIQQNNKHAETLLKRAIDHNKRALDKLQSMANEAFDASKTISCPPGTVKAPLDSAVREAMNWFQFDPENDFVSYFPFSIPHHQKYCTNIVKVTAESGNPQLRRLTEELNGLYKAIQNVQPDTSNY